MAKESDENMALVKLKFPSKEIIEQTFDQMVNFGHALLNIEAECDELKTRLIKSQDIYKEPRNMKCHTCKFNTREGFPFPCPPCYVVDWENSSAEEYDFSKCLFYQEDKFEVFIQKLEKELDPNKEI